MIVAPPAGLRWQALPGGFAPWVAPASWAATTVRSLPLPVRVGGQTCMIVRARDLAGNVSAWSERCVSGPVDDAALSASAGWSRLVKTSFWHGTVTATSSAGRVLSMPGANARRVVLVATTCSTCGSVGVYIGTRLMGTVSLRTPSTHFQAQIALPNQPVFATGTLTIRTLPAGLVEVDGVAFDRVVTALP